MSTPGPTDTQTNEKPHKGAQQPQPSNEEIDWEKRYKDLQGNMTKVTQENSTLKKTNAQLQAETGVYKEQVKPVLNLDDDIKKELDDLMYSDPVAWRSRMNQLENEALSSHNAKIQEAVQTTTQQLEEADRKTLLEQFNTGHQDVELTEELLQLDIPSRLTSKMEKGEITYSEYLQEAYDFVKAPKVIGDGNATLNQPNLGKAGGDDTPTKQGTKSEFNYEEALF